ncbi:MAG: hypothetical protein ABIW76_11560 [Fibrobacteria bacterium]
MAPFIDRATLGWALFLAVAGCGDDKGYTPKPVPVEEGIFITDTSYTLDDFNFDSTACREVFPAGSENTETRAPDAVASLRIISTACYHARVVVTDEDKDTVRTFDSRFAISNRSEAEKNRGVVGYVSWDGNGNDSSAQPGGIYHWRMEIDFGKGRLRKFRTDVLIPGRGETPGL